MSDVDEDRDPCMPRPIAPDITLFICGICHRTTTVRYYKGRRDSDNDSMPTCDTCYHDHYVDPSSHPSHHSSAIINCTACEVYEFDGFMLCWACEKEINISEHDREYLGDECTTCGAAPDSSCLLRWCVYMFRPKKEILGSRMRNVNGAGWRMVEGKVGTMGVVDEPVVSREVREFFGS